MMILTQRIMYLFYRFLGGSINSAKNVFVLQVF